MQDCLRNISLDVRQANRLGQRIGVNAGVYVVGGGCMGRNPGDEFLTLTGCHSYMKPLGGNLSAAEPTT